MKLVATQVRRSTFAIAAGVPGPPGPPGTPDETQSTFIAGEVLSGHRAVWVADGVARCADAGVLPAAEQCVGVTSHAAAAGADIRVKRAGLLREPTWQWAPGPVYLGPDGALVQTPPEAGVLLQIGVALDATTLDVRVGTPIQLD